MRVHLQAERERFGVVGDEQSVDRAGPGGVASEEDALAWEGQTLQQPKQYHELAVVGQNALAVAKGTAREAVQIAVARWNFGAVVSDECSLPFDRVPD